jgi:flagellin-like protein
MKIVKNFKGISPVIATILMVMITVGLVALSYTFFVNIINVTENRTIENVGTVLENQKVIITSVWNDSTDGKIGVAINSRGTDDASLSNVKAFVNNVPINWTAADVDGCQANGVLKIGSSCNMILGKNYDVGDVVKIVSPDGTWNTKTAT